MPPADSRVKPGTVNASYDAADDVLARAAPYLNWLIVPSPARRQKMVSGTEAAAGTGTGSGTPAMVGTRTPRKFGGERPGLAGCSMRSDQFRLGRTLV